MSVGRGAALLALSLFALPACRQERLPEERTLLESADADARFRAALEVAENPAIPTERAVEALAAALERELEEPTDVPRAAGSWFTASEVAAWNYASAAGLRGEEAVPELRERREDAAGSTAEWLLLAQAYAGDEETAEGLIGLLDSESAAVRAQAARLLGELGIRAAIEPLTRLLRDSFRAPPPADLPGSPGSYPVRSAAADALRELGVEVWPARGEAGAYEVVR